MNLIIWLDSEVARRRWGRWKGIRVVLAYLVWYARYKP
jgi:hypothetical protein